MLKWATENNANEPILQQIMSNFNRGTLSKPINTTNPFRFGLRPPDVEAPLIDDRHVEQIFVTLCADVRIYKGLLIHAMTHLVPDLKNYHKLRQQLTDDINASRAMQFFDLPSTIEQPFGAGRRELAAAFCQCIRDYYQKLREKVNA